MKTLFKIFSIALVGLLMSCETTELSLRDNPNQVSPSQAEVEFLYNSVQTNFGGFVQSLGSTSGEVVRVNYMFGRSYQNAYSPQAFDFRWRQAYQIMFSDMDVMNPKAIEEEKFIHMGQAQIMKAYTLVTLVDMFGDIPFSQAGQPVEFPNPIADSGADVYAAALDLLDQGLSNLSGSSAPGPVADLLYGGDLNAWKKAANSIKLKVYLQTRLTNGSAISNFNSIISSGNYIQNSSEDFQFNWGNQLVDPGASAHPAYLGDYTESGAGNYQSNYLMNHMLGDDKDDGTDDDPRIRYYFFRQSGETPGYGDNDGNQQVLACSEQSAPGHYSAEDAYCALANGYWGRDHGNAEGIPPDGFSKTAVAVYPAAGRADADFFDRDSGNRKVGVGLGGVGQGITPIILASTIDFYKAEIALFENGNANTAFNLMEDGITKSIIKVKSFLSRDTTLSSDDTDFIAANTQTTTSFISSVESEYNGGGDDTKKNVLGNQLFVNVFGNGLDAYAFYRRTGFPKNLQPNIEANPGAFIRSFLYPANEANNNANINQKPDVKQQVFWDNNPASPGFPSAN